MMNLPTSKFTMAGTEGTGEYVGVADTARGTVAVRQYRPGSFRIRVEPKSVKAAAVIGRKLTRKNGWKQPGDGGQNRFSKVMGTMGLAGVLKEASDALGVGALKTTELDSVAALRHVAKLAGATVSARDNKTTVLAKATRVNEQPNP